MSREKQPRGTQVQVRLRSGDTERTCWVDRADIHPDQVITLKNSEDPQRQWRIVAVHTEGAPPERGWHVGGL